MSATSATTKTTLQKMVSADEIDAFRVKFTELNGMMRAIFAAYSELKSQEPAYTDPKRGTYTKKIHPLENAIKKYGGGPVREFYWLFTGARCDRWVLDFLEHIDTLEKLTTEHMLTSIASKKYGPYDDCFREFAKQVGQYIARYAHLVPRQNPLPSSMAALCASAHNISTLRQQMRTRKIDVKTENGHRQRLETRILAKLGWWMTTTGKTDKERMSWVAYLEAHQLTKMDPTTQTAITDSIEDWLIAMRAIEHSYVLLRKNADLQDRLPTGNIAFIGFEQNVNGGPGIRVAIDEDTCARWITWTHVARDDVYYPTNIGKPRDYGMPSDTKLHVLDLGMD